MSGAKLYKVDGTVEEIAPENCTDFMVHELHKHINGYFTFVHLPDGRVGVVDEEAMWKGKKHNMQASAILGQHLLGDIIICPGSMLK